MEKITIITVCRNDLDGLKETASSIIPLLNSNLLWIVIDGASSDGTSEYLESLKQDLYYFVSEPDDGIYDAMNKGARFAPDDSFLAWINSGDSLISSPLHQLYNDVVFFGVCLKEKNINLYPKILIKINPESIVSPYSTYFHQGFFIKKTIFNKYFYMPKVGLSADMLLMCKVIINENYSIVNKAIAIYGTEGISNRKPLSLLISHFQVVRVLNMSSLRYANLNKIFILKSLLKILLPYKFIFFLRKFFN